MSENGKEKRVTVSVVTATYNAANHLPKLIESLLAQTDKDFEWVVADGASTDGTLELLQSVDGINIAISSQPDFGIYDALNRAIKISSGKYYIVCGADDFFITMRSTIFVEQSIVPVRILLLPMQCTDNNALKLEGSRRG